MTSRALLLALAILLCGCREVRVVDPAGHPIAGAWVGFVAPSFSNGVKTDIHGIAHPPSLIGAQTLNIDAVGYRCTFYPLPVKYPLTVMLSPGHDDLHLFTPDDSKKRDPGAVELLLSAPTVLAAPVNSPMQENR